MLNRNVEAHFTELPSVEIERSILDLSHGHHTSFDCGEVVPLMCQEILPGSTIKLTMSSVLRLQTLLTPLMDSLVFDTYAFFCPMRLTWDHTKQFFGESENAWVPQTQYSIPQITSPSGGWSVGSIADHLGIPPGVGNLSVSALPMRGYAIIMSEWFRDQNLSDPLVVNTGDANSVGSNGSGLSDTALGGKPYIAAKLHDYFSSCLPGAQKAANPVTIAPATAAGYSPIYARDTQVPNFSTKTNAGLGLSYYDGTLGITAGTHYDLRMLGESTSGGKVIAESTASSGSYDIMAPNNLWADVNVTLGSVSINDLRLAFQMQKWYERAARSGSRYRETIMAHFGVRTEDARMMIPEYLGGRRIPIDIHQVTNTSESSSAKLGDLGAMSNTSDVQDMFMHSFTEHGYLYILGVVRYPHSYPQGIHKHWFRKDMFDFYWPEMANIGETPVYKKQIMATGTSTDDDVFGYNEAWAEYRFMPNTCSSLMRPGVSGSLASWNLSDYYSTVPTLSDSWIREDKTMLDRALAVTSSVSNQIFADFWFQEEATMPMPVYSVPGLIDHH